MKKLNLLLPIIVLLFLVTPLKASENVDNKPTIVGRVYPTDIKAFVNNRPIRSFNINGSTALVCSDLKDHGFKVFQAEDGQYINIALSEEININDTKNVSGSKDTNKFVNVYSSDIQVRFNSILIPSYRIKDETVIMMEDLNEATGCKFTWDGINRRVYVELYEAGDIISSSDGTFQVSQIMKSNEFVLEASTYIRFHEGTINTTYYDYFPLGDVLGSIGWDYTVMDSVISIEKKPMSKSSDKELIVNTDKKPKESKEPSSVAYICQATLKGHGTVECIVYDDQLYLSSEDLERILDKVYVGNAHFVSNDSWSAIIDQAQWIYWRPENQRKATNNRLDLGYWITSTYPVCPPSGRGGPMLQPQYVGDEVSVTFPRAMDKESFNAKNMKVLCVTKLTRQLVDVTNKITTSYDEDAFKLIINIDQIDREKYDSMKVVFAELKNNLGEVAEKDYAFEFVLR